MEPKLRRALVATFGVDEGRDATAAALGYAWEHWDRIESMANPVGYLYRVGQTSRRQRASGMLEARAVDPVLPDVELQAALAGLSEQQRCAVVLVHAFGWTLEDAAKAMSVSVSTLRNHLARGLERLRRELSEDRDAVTG